MKEQLTEIQNALRAITDKQQWLEKAKIERESKNEGNNTHKDLQSRNTQKNRTSEQKVTVHENEIKETNLIQNKDTKAKKVRSKKIKNELKQFKIIYQNIRGIKSKVDSLAEMVEDQKHAIVCLVEKEEVAIPDYETIYRYDKSANSGGILVAVKNNIKTVTMQTHKQEQVGEGLWILTDNKKTKLKLGVIYVPQENTTPNKELKKMYQEIKDRIEQTRQQCQNMINLGDFNAKIGIRIKGNKETLTKGGRQIVKLEDKQDKVILDEESEICKGLWTREQREENSVTDYVITNKETLQKRRKLIFDENKEYATYRTECQQHQVRIIYSDHNVILLEIDYITKLESSKQINFITNKGYKECKNILRQENLTKILQNQNLQESYTKWTNAVEYATKSQ